MSDRRKPALRSLTLPARPILLVFAMPKPFYPAAATALLHAALLVCYVGGFGGDVSALVCVDRDVIGRAAL